MLQARKERVQLGQRGALAGFQLFHGGDAAGEFALEVERGDGNSEIPNINQVKVLNGDALIFFEKMRKHRRTSKQPGEKLSFDLFAIMLYETEALEQTELMRAVNDSHISK